MKSRLPKRPLPPFLMSSVLEASPRCRRCRTPGSPRHWCSSAADHAVTMLQIARRCTRASRIGDRQKIAQIGGDAVLSVGSGAAPDTAPSLHVRSGLGSDFGLPVAV